MSEIAFVVFVMLVALSALLAICPAPFGRFVEWLFNRIWQ